MCQSLHLLGPATPHTSLGASRSHGFTLSPGVDGQAIRSFVVVVVAVHLAGGAAAAAAAAAATAAAANPEGAPAATAVCPAPRAG